VDSYDITVFLRGCGELVIQRVEQADSGDDEVVAFVVRAYRPGA
jgi:hypothetical protein